MQQNKAQKVIEEVKKAFIGKTECVEKLMTAILAWWRMSREWEKQPWRWPLPRQ